MTARSRSRPGLVTLADWRAIYQRRCRRRSIRLPRRGDRGERARPSTRIVARGEPVYGINTGFGKLASVQHRG